MPCNDELPRSLDDRLDARRFRAIFGANTFGVCCGVNDRIVDGNDAFLNSISAVAGLLAEGIELQSVFGSAAAQAARFCDGVAREYEITRLDGESANIIAVGVATGAD